MAAGQIIRELRTSRNLTQKALSEATGIPLRTLVNYENSDREPNAKNMAILEQYFNVSAAYLRGKPELIKPIVTDPDTLQIVREQVPDGLKELASLLERGSDAEVEVAYHLVNELTHVLKMENKVQRDAAMSVLQDILVATVFFLDSCENCIRDVAAADRLEHVKDIVRPRFEVALSKSEFFLPK